MNLYLVAGIALAVGFVLTALVWDTPVTVQPCRSFEIDGDEFRYETPDEADEWRAAVAA